MKIKEMRNCAEIWFMPTIPWNKVQAREAGAAKLNHRQSSMEDLPVLSINVKENLEVQFIKLLLIFFIFYPGNKGEFVTNIGIFTVNVIFLEKRFVKLK